MAGRTPIRDYSRFAGRIGGQVRSETVVAREAEGDRTQGCEDALAQAGARRDYRVRKQQRADFRRLGSVRQVYFGASPERLR